MWSFVHFGEKYSCLNENKASRIWYQIIPTVWGKECGFLYKMEVYAGVHRTYDDYNTAFNVINKMCGPNKNM
jgi:hypothetical protein